MRLQRDVEAARMSGRALPWATTERLLGLRRSQPHQRQNRSQHQAFGGFAGCRMDGRRREYRRRRTAIRRDTQEQTARNLRLAERLGAETRTLVGEMWRTQCCNSLPHATSRRSSSAKPPSPDGSVRFSARSPMNYWSAPATSTSTSFPARAKRRAPAAVLRWNQASRLDAVSSWRPSSYRLRACRLGRAFGGAAEANIVMIFLGGVALVSARYGRGPSIASAMPACWCSIFSSCRRISRLPYRDAQYVITFAVMLGIGLLISELTSRLQAQLRASQQQEHRTAQLFRMTRQLTELAGSEFLVRTAGRQLAEIFDGEVVMFLREPNGSLALRFGENTSVAQQQVNAVVAQWVIEQQDGRRRHRHAAKCDGSVCSHDRFAANGRRARRPAKDERRLRDPEQQRLLETCASLIALSIERDESVLEAHEAQLQVEAEQLRNSLLNSVSHDLRTPLATIAGAASSLVERSAGDDKELLQTVVDESRRLTRLVDNLLAWPARCRRHNAQPAMARAGRDRRRGAQCSEAGT